MQYDDDEGGKFKSYGLTEPLKPHEFPCGGTYAGKIHFSAETEAKAFIAWKTSIPDESGTCTIKLRDTYDEGTSGGETLKPLSDENANKLT